MVKDVLETFCVPGHAVTGDRTRRDRRNGPGYVFLHVAVDDHSRYAYVEQHPDERGETTALFMARAIEHFAEPGLSAPEAVMSYWYDSSPEFLWSLGVDPERQPPRYEWSDHCHRMVGPKPDLAEGCPLVGEINGQIFGYAILNHIEQGESCQGHVHIFDEANRHRGFVSRLFGAALPLAFDLVTCR